MLKSTGLAQCVLRNYQRFIMSTAIRCQDGLKNRLFQIGNCHLVDGRCPHTNYQMILKKEWNRLIVHYTFFLILLLNNMAHQQFNMNVNSQEK